MSLLVPCPPCFKSFTKNVRVGFCVLFFFTSSTLAGGKVDYLNVEADKVFFSTTLAKTGTVPGCVETINQNKWALSLATETGRAIYSLLITAMAGSLPIDVVSAEDCADADGIERPSAVSIAPDTGLSSSQGGGFYLYKGDGVTKLGYILDVSDNRTEIRYVPISESYTLARHWFPTKASIFFSSAGCQGEAYIGSATYRIVNPFFEDGKLLDYDRSGFYTLDSLSYLGLDGVCVEQVNEDIRLYKFTVGQNALCGEKPCLIKDY